MIFWVCISKYRVCMIIWLGKYCCLCLCKYYQKISQIRTKLCIWTFYLSWLTLFFGPLIKSKYNGCYSVWPRLSPSWLNHPCFLTAPTFKVRVHFLDHLTYGNECILLYLKIWAYEECLCIFVKLAVEILVLYHWKHQKTWFINSNTILKKIFLSLELV